MQVHSMDASWQLRHVGLKLTRKDVPEIMRLKKPRTTIGRGLHNDFILDSTTFEGFVSRTHAIIIRQESPSGPIYTVYDNSTNGTIVNDYRIHEKHILQENDTIAFGHMNGLNVRKGEFAFQPPHEFVYKFERCNPLAPDPDTPVTSQRESKMSAASVAESRGDAGYSSSEEVSSYHYSAVPLRHQVSISDSMEDALRKRGTLRSDTDLDVTSIDLTQCTDDDIPEDSEDDEKAQRRAEPLILKRNTVSKKGWSCLPRSCLKDKENLRPGMSPEFSMDKKQSNSVEKSEADGLHTCSMSDDLNNISLGRHEGSAPDGRHEDPFSSDFDAGQSDGDSVCKAAQRTSGSQRSVGVKSKRRVQIAVEEESLPDISSIPSSVASGENIRGCRQESRATNFCRRKVDDFSQDSTLSYCDTRTTSASDSEKLRKAGIYGNSHDNAGYEGSSEEDYSENAVVYNTNNSSSASSGKMCGSRLKGAGQVTKWPCRSESPGHSSFPNGADMESTSRVKRREMNHGKALDLHGKLRRTADWVMVANEKHVLPSKPSQPPSQQDKNLFSPLPRRVLLGLRPLRHAADQSGDAPAPAPTQKVKMCSKKTEGFKQPKRQGGTRKNHVKRWKNDDSKEAASRGTRPVFVVPHLPAPEVTQPEDEVLESGVEWYEDELCDLPNCQRPMGKRLHWVQCDSCSRWCHTVCVGCDYEAVKDSEKFYCGC